MGARLPKDYGNAVDVYQLTKCKVGPVEQAMRRDQKLQCRDLFRHELTPEDERGSSYYLALIPCYPAMQQLDKRAMEAMLEAWKRVVSTSGTRAARARVKVDRA